MPHSAGLICLGHQLFDEFLGLVEPELRVRGRLFQLDPEALFGLSQFGEGFPSGDEAGLGLSDAKPDLGRIGYIRRAAARTLGTAVVLQGHSQLLVGGQCIVAEGDHGLNLPGSGRLFPELAGLRLAAADAAALIDAVRQQSQRLGVALVGGTLVIVNGLIPPAVAGSLVAAVQLICAGGVEVPPRRAEQPLQDGIVQRGGIRPRVDDTPSSPSVFKAYAMASRIPRSAMGRVAVVRSASAVFTEVNSGR